MRYLLVFLLLCTFMVQARSRPPTVDNEGDEEEVDYENIGDDADENDESLREEDDIAEEQESAVGDQDEIGRSQRYQDQGSDAEYRRNPAEDLVAKNKEDSDFPDYKINKIRDTHDNTQENSINSDKIYQSKLLHRQEKYDKVDLTDNQIREQRLVNSDVQSVKSPIDKSQTKRRMDHNSENKEDDVLFENYEDTKVQPKAAFAREYKNEPVNRHGQSRYVHHYYNSMEADNTDNNPHNNLHINANRDRRQAAEAAAEKYELNLLSTSKLDDENNSSEDEEAAIKRHVRKLSEPELQELLNSLSEDKRELLKKIMSSDEDAKDSINKREITKKAGATAESNLATVDTDNKIQGLSQLDVGTSTTSSSSEPKPTEIPSESTPEINTAKTETVVTSVSSSSNDRVQLFSDVPEPDKVQSGVNVLLPSGASDIQNSVSKVPSKREINIDDVSDLDSLFDDKTIGRETQDFPNEQGYYCPQDDDLSQLTQDEFENNENIYKREANDEPSLSDSIKSLEESFPNSNAYDDADPYAGSNMAPLVRVKRKNEKGLVKKRAAGLLPDAKVAYFPSKSENEDEDNNEGNEFDDEGFYDPSSSLIENNDETMQDDSKNSCAHKLRKHPETNINQDNTLQNVESDPSLGSDTDNVISGESVDENLMFSSGARNRRSNDGSPNNQDEQQNRPLRSTPFMDDIKTAESSLNGPNYQESDAFGPLPRNYEGELSRYKRIRRVKQPSSQDTSASPE